MLFFALSIDVDGFGDTVLLFIESFRKGVGDDG